MLQTPQFKNYFRIETVENTGVFLLSESDYLLLQGHLYELLAPLIDGKRTVTEIIDLLQGKISAAEIYYGLMEMEKKGYLHESNQQPPQTTAFWHSLKVSPPEATKKLQTTTIAVTSYGNINTDSLIPILQSLLIAPHELNDEASSVSPLIKGGLGGDLKRGGWGDLTIVLTDDYLQPQLKDFNQQALKEGKPWLLVKPVGTTIWVGPIFMPGKTACWQCLAQRLQANRPVEVFLKQHHPDKSHKSTSVAQLPSTVNVALNLAATELAKWIVKPETSQISDRIITLDTLTWETQKHILVKRPQCPICGESNYHSEREPEPVILQSQKKTFTADGGHRSVTPQATLAKYGHHVSPITGAVRSIQKVKQSDHKLTPNYIAGHNFASMFDGLYFLRENLRGKSAGKGKSEEQAKASALGEAIERYSGVFQGDEIRRQATYNQLGDEAIHPNDCMLFSEEQYRSREEWHQQCNSFFQKVPHPFEPEETIEWTPVWSLRDRQFKYLPTAYCYYGYPKPSRPSCWADSNGTAAGNSREEAILQGFMELVERDSVATWWYNRLQYPQVDLESFNQPYFQELQAYYHTLHRELWVLDITNDLNIPTFAAISYRTDKEVQDIIYAFGAHFDSRIAITRALTELNQVLPAVFHDNADGSTKYACFDELAVNWWRNATLTKDPYVLPMTGVPKKKAADYPQLGSDDLLEDVMTCVDIAAQKGLETLVLDQTRPDIGLNVVKVIVPGLRHFWKRLGPGRLYQVPVTLGKLSQPLSEQQLNPYPIFF